eukprot:IDg140t1
MCSVTLSCREKSTLGPLPSAGIVCHAARRRPLKACTGHCSDDGDGSYFRPRRTIELVRRTRVTVDLQFSPRANCRQTGLQ